MIFIDWSIFKHIPWYFYVLSGFVIGVYLHCHLIRHWLHTLIIKLLQGIIWLFQRTDFYYKPPKPGKPKPKVAVPPDNEIREGIEVETAELKRWLDKNPDLFLSNRHKSL